MKTSVTVPDFFYGTGTGAVSSKLRHQHRHRHQRNIQEYSTENNFGWKKKFFLSKPSKVIEMIWSTEWPKQFKYWKILHSYSVNCNCKDKINNYPEYYREFLVQIQISFVKRKILVFNVHTLISSDSFTSFTSHNIDD